MHARALVRSSIAWGADYTANHSAVLNPGEGYTITKVNLIAPVLKPQLAVLLADAGVPNADALANALAPGLAENFAETAVDVLIKRTQDPQIGTRLLLSAQLRDFRIPFAFANAYGPGLASESGMSVFKARMVLRAAEREYRDLIRMY